MRQSDKKWKEKKERKIWEMFQRLGADKFLSPPLLSLAKHFSNLVAFGMALDIRN